MLTARVQLQRVEELLAEFTRDDGEMRPLALYQAQHLAMLAMLRSVGHVLDKVDAHTPARKSWLDERWSCCKREPIFREFIDFERNRLLKEFRGGIDPSDPAIMAKAAVADLLYPRHESLTCLGQGAARHSTSPVQPRPTSSSDGDWGWMPSRMNCSG